VPFNEWERGAAARLYDEHAPVRLRWAISSNQRRGTSLASAARHLGLPTFRCRGAISMPPAPTATPTREGGTSADARVSCARPAVDGSPSADAPESMRGTGWPGG